MGSDIDTILVAAAVSDIHGTQQSIVIMLSTSQLCRVGLCSSQYLQYPIPPSAACRSCLKKTTNHHSDCPDRHTYRGAAFPDITAIRIENPNANRDIGAQGVTSETSETGFYFILPLRLIARCRPLLVYPALVSAMKTLHPRNRTPDR